MKTMTAWLTLTAIAFGGDSEKGESGEQTDYLKARPEVVEAWQDMRFGMFVCWGPVSLTGKEIGWSRGAPAWGRRPGVRGGRGATPAKVYDALYETGEVLRTLGREDEAKEMYRRFIRWAPDDDPRREVLNRLYPPTNTP